MAMTGQALRAEIETDPRSYSYAPTADGSRDQPIADLLNLPRTGSNGGPAITIRRSDLTRQEVLEAIDVRDFISNANALQASYFESVTQSDNIRLIRDDGSDTTLLANMVRAVNNTNGSQTRLRAMAVRAGSRAEELWGRDTFVTNVDVALALRG
jgi:hypothetical protein